LLVLAALLSVVLSNLPGLWQALAMTFVALCSFRFFRQLRLLNKSQSIHLNESMLAKVQEGDGAIEGKVIKARQFLSFFAILIRYRRDQRWENCWYYLDASTLDSSQQRYLRLWFRCYLTACTH